MVVGVVNVFAVVVFTIALCWRIDRLRRTRAGVQSVAMTVSIAALSLAFVVNGKAMRHWIDFEVFTGLARTIFYCLLALGVAALVVVFFFGERDEVRQRRAGVEAIPLVVAVIGLNVAMVYTPETIRTSRISVAHVRDIGFAVFFLIAGCYLVYGLVACVKSIYRYLRLADGYLRTSLALTLGGLVLMATGTLIQTLFVLGSFVEMFTTPVLLPISSVLEVGGVVIFFLGICFPMARTGWVAMRTRRRDRHAYRELEPLWAMLTAEFPAVVLPNVRGRPSARLRRRVVEIRDALVQISPYLPGDFDQLDTAVQVGALDVAMHQHHSDTNGPAAVREVLPAEGPGIEGDAAPLLRLSRLVAGREARHPQAVPAGDQRVSAEPSGSRRPS